MLRAQEEKEAARAQDEDPKDFIVIPRRFDSFANLHLLQHSNTDLWEVKARLQSTIGC